MTSHCTLNTFRYFKIPLQALQDLAPGSPSGLITSLSPLPYSLYLLDTLAFYLVLNMPNIISVMSLFSFFPVSSYYPKLCVCVSANIVNVYTYIWVWKAAIHRVAQSQTQLKWLSKHTCIFAYIVASIYIYTDLYTYNQIYMFTFYLPFTMEVLQDPSQLT